MMTLRVVALSLLASATCLLLVWALNRENRSYLIMVSPHLLEMTVDEAITRSHSDHCFEIVRSKVQEGVAGFFPVPESEVRSSDPQFLSVRRYFPLPGEQTARGQLETTLAALSREKEHSAFVASETGVIRWLWISCLATFLASIGTACSIASYRRSRHAGS